MSLQGKRIAIPTEEMYHVLELWYPYYRLKEEGAEPVIVGTGTAPIHYSKDHYPVTPHTTADKVTADEFDGMVVPGGYAPDLMRRHPAMLKLVKDIFDQGKVMAAICHAGWLLVSAGVLKGRKATCFFRHQGRHDQRRGPVRGPGGGGGRQPDHQQDAGRPTGVHENRHQGPGLNPCPAP